MAIAARDDDVGADIRGHISATLSDVAREHGVRILYAAESGSRAWGFGSPDSDYDVRFIYAHEPAWYLGLAQRRDVIERALDDRLVDLAGWDVRKALGLLLKSNPTLYEWFVSPIVYADDGTFRNAARSIFVEHASPRALAAHYWSIARGQFHREIDGRTDVKLKKYFYVVRPLLSLLSVIETGAPPPMNIQPLVDAADIGEPLRAEIEALLQIKRVTPELGRGARIPTIDAWATDLLTRYAPERLDISDQPHRDGLAAAEDLFRQTIGLGNV